MALLERKQDVPRPQITATIRFPLGEQGQILIDRIERARRINDLSALVDNEAFGDARRIGSKMRATVPWDPTDGAIIRGILLRIPEAERPFFTNTASIDPRVRRLNREQGMDAESRTRAEFLEDVTELGTGQKTRLTAAPLRFREISNLVTENYGDDASFTVLAKTVDARFAKLNELHSVCIHDAQQKRGDLFNLVEEKLHSAHSAVLQDALSSMGELGTNSAILKLYGTARYLLDRNYTGIVGDGASAPSLEIPAVTKDPDRIKFQGVLPITLTSLAEAMRRNNGDGSLLVEAIPVLRSWERELGPMHPASGALLNVLDRIPRR